ncbi:MAG: DUF1273 family protein [Oscillospiraceae bacterium]|nr:DUF1273 family protein [Oscillospiraceae bacterium]
MIIDRSKTVCFTGHRPDKLPDGGDDRSPVTKVLKSLIYSEIQSAVNDGFDTFITGMQRGVDLWAGEAVLEMMAEKDLHIVAALPYRDFGKYYKGKDKWVAGRILAFAEQTVIMSETYTPSCMKLRNQFMIENSSRLIAVLGEEHSGSGQTVRLAEKAGLDIHCIDLPETGSGF